MQRIFIMLLLAVGVLTLTACDGSIHLTPEGAVQDASVREIVRGLASLHEQVEEDPETSDNRKAFYEMVAAKAGADLSKGFIATLQANRHYSDIEVKSAELGGGEERLVTIVVRFKVDHNAAVQMAFLSPQKIVFGLIHLNKLPLLNEVQMASQGHRLVIRMSDEVLMATILNPDRDQFANTVAAQIASDKKAAEQALATQGLERSTESAPSGSNAGDTLSNTPSGEPIRKPGRELASEFKTTAGVMSVLKDEQGTSHVTLDKRPIFGGDDAAYQQPVQLFHINDQTDVVLMESSGGRGTRCQTLFFFLILPKNQAMRWTPEFGTCASEGNFALVGEEVRLDIPKIGGFAHYRLVNGAVTDEHGVPVKSDPDLDPAH